MIKEPLILKKYYLEGLQYLSLRNIVIVIFLTSLSLSSQTYEESTKSNKYFNASLFFYTGAVFGASAKDFFDAYKSRLIGGVNTDFRHSPHIEAGLKLKILDELKLTFNASYFKAEMRDGFVIPIPNTDTERRFDENLTVSTLPVTAALEYVPFANQFRTFLGLGAGAALSEVRWVETVYSPVMNDKRKGGVHINTNDILPIFRLYAGVDLGFDKERFDSLLGGIIIRAEYSYLVRNMKMLSSVSGQIDDAPDNWLSGNYNIIAGYLSFGVAVYLNFNWELKSNIKQK